MSELKITPETQKILDSLGAAREAEEQLISKNAKAAGSQKIRTFLQGVSMGWSDEVEGAIASMFSDNTYDEERDAIRAKLKAFKAANPKQALSLEVIGAIVPMFTPVGWLAKGAGVSATAARAFLAAGTEGAVYGAGSSEGRNVGEVSGDTVTGAVTSLATGGGLWMAGQGIKGIGNAAYKWTRERLGDKAASVVEAELAELVAKTGKSVDEVVSDIASGRIMANNETLTIAIKTIVNEGGEAGREAIKLAARNNKISKSRAVTSLQRLFSPDSLRGDGNLVRYMDETEEALLAAERKEYGDAFELTPEVTGEIQMTLQNLVTRFPTAAKELKKLYEEMGMGSDAFIKADADGNIVLNKMASLEDAETMYRVLRDTTSKLYKDSKGTRAKNLKGLANDLKEQLDSTYSGLATARSNASIVRDSADAFKEGRKMFSDGQNVEAVDVYLTKLIKEKDPQVVQGFLNGFLTTAKSKINFTPSAMKRLGDDSTNISQVLRTVMGKTGKQGEEVLAKLDIGGGANALKVGIPSVAGSPTQALTREANRRGTGAGAGILRSAVSGMPDPESVLNIVQRMTSNAPIKITPEQNMEIVKVLFSTNPEVVRKALTDETGMAQLGNAVGNIVDGFLKGANRPIQQQSTQETMDTKAGKFVRDFGNYSEQGIMSLINGEQ